MLIFYLLSSIIFFSSPNICAMEALEPSKSSVNFELKTDGDLTEEHNLFVRMHLDNAESFSQNELGNAEPTLQETLKRVFEQTKNDFIEKKVQLVIAQERISKTLLGYIFFLEAEKNGKPVIRIKHLNVRNIQNHQELKMLFQGMLPLVLRQMPHISSILCVSRKAVTSYDDALKAIGFNPIDFVPAGCDGMHQQTYELLIG